MDEVELVQLLNDHKFGNFVGGVELSEDTARSRKAVEGVVKEVRPKRFLTLLLCNLGTFI